MHSVSFIPGAAGALLLAAGSLAVAPASAAEPADQVAEVFNRPITNIPGKSLIAVEVNYAPGQKSPEHWHEKSAFIMAYVVKGAIRSQVEGEAAHVFHAGETWHEDPGAHHVLSENASATEPATLLAVFVVDTDHEPLTRYAGSE